MEDGNERNGEAVNDENKVFELLAGYRVRIGADELSCRPGSNAHGQLGNDTLEDSHTFQPCSFDGCTPGALPSENCSVVDVANGANHTLVLLDLIDNSGHHKREVWGCGDGRTGQLGRSYQEDIQDRLPTSVFRKIELSFDENGLDSYSWKFICASWETSYAILSHEVKQDVIISMGADDLGDLGVGRKIKGKEKQSKESFYVVSLDHITIAGMRLQLSSIHVEEIVAGQHHVIARVQASLSNGDRRTFGIGWGSARHGQLGEPDELGKKAPQSYSLPKVVYTDDLTSPVTSLSLGMHHSVFLHANGALNGIGSNRRNQLHTITTLFPVRKIGCTWNGTYALVEDGRGRLQLYATGSNTHGQLASEPPAAELTTISFSSTLSTYSPNQIACGSEHVLILLCMSEHSEESESKQWEVWGWGWNEHGNLGTGSTDDVWHPLRLWPTLGDSQRPIGIWAGNGTSWIYCEDVQPPLG